LKYDDEIAFAAKNVMNLAYWRRRTTTTAQYQTTNPNRRSHMPHTPYPDYVARFARRFGTLTDESNRALAAEVLDLLERICEEHLDFETVCCELDPLHNRVANAHPDGGATDPEVRLAVLGAIVDGTSFDIEMAWFEHAASGELRIPAEPSRTRLTMHPEHDCEDCGIYHTAWSSHASGAAKQRLIYMPTESRERPLIDGDQRGHFEN
jgi:hypothetical protein